MILPVPWNIGLLMAAGAEIRYVGKVRWLDVESNEPSFRNVPQIVAILKPL
jgi:hypothetical protein